MMQIPKSALFLVLFCSCSGQILYNRVKIRSNLDQVIFDKNRVQVFSLDEKYWPAVVPNRFPLPGIPTTPLYSGLDVLSFDNYSLIRGRKFALLTNATGLNRDLKRGLELMLAEGIRPSLIFEPEHGLFGALDEAGEDGIRIDPHTELKYLSLYSKRKKPEKRHLEGIDLIVVDIHNLSVRPYTYISTLTYIMEAAEESNIEVMILDRSNPYSLWQPQGPYLEEEYTGFTAAAPVPFLYSLTPGEYGLYMSAAAFHKLRMTVVKVAGYSREDKLSSLKDVWINPSPNIPNYESALVYPGVVLFEAVNISLGRGTTRPFVYSGAPWMNSAEVVSEMKRLKLPGVKFAEVVFTPSASVYKGKTCRGIQILPVSAEFDSLRTGYEYMRIVRRLHPADFEMIHTKKGYYMDRLWGGTLYREFIEDDLPYSDFRKVWESDAQNFKTRIKPFLLY